MIDNYKSKLDYEYVEPSQKNYFIHGFKVMV